MKYIISIVLCLISYSSFSQVLELTIPEGRFQFDESLKIIVSQIDSIENYADLSAYNEVTIRLADSVYQFTEMPDVISHANDYAIKNGDRNFRLFFTQFPIITIDNEIEIEDEPKSPAQFSYTNAEQEVSSTIGIELRGGFSQTYPKKTYDLEFWEDESGEKTDSYQLGDLRKDDDWILDALYNEPLRIRAYLSHKLWLQMHSPYYLEEEPNAKSGADVEYVEMFLNGRYNGVYLLSEQVDKKQLQLKSFKDGEIRGELYKGKNHGDATDYKGVPSFDNMNRLWGGQEMKYPKDDEITDWSKLHEFVDFVLNANDTTFDSQIGQQVHLENIMEYFLFLNVVRGTDNRGKNIYTARYTQGEPYFFVPWDLDGTWGNRWDGENDITTFGILSNGLYDRLLSQNSQDIKTRLKEKWNNYRSNLLSNESLDSMVNEAYQLMVDNNIYEREKLITDFYDFEPEGKTYLLEWLEDRLIALDGELDVILSNSYTGEDHSFQIFPNPARQQLFVNYDNLIHQGDLSFRIFDLRGQLLLEGQVNQNRPIDISSLNAGVYFFEMSGAVQKLMVL